MSSRTKQVAFRFPSELLDRLDRCVAKFEDEMPGAGFSRTDAVRILLEKALAAEGLPLKSNSSERGVAHAVEVRGRPKNIQAAEGSHTLASNLTEVDL